MKEAIFHLKGKSGCGYMAVRLQDGKVTKAGLGKGCRGPVRMDVGAPTRCVGCHRRIHLQPIAMRQVMGIRCFYCFKTLCFRCARRHFRRKRGRSGAARERRHEAAESRN